MEGGLSGFIDLEFDLGRTFSLEERCWEVGRDLRSWDYFFFILKVKVVGS